MAKKQAIEVEASVKYASVKQNNVGKRENVVKNGLEGIVKFSK